ncbi:MAG: hypothetical protein R2689_13795 [Microthrixaceae bacterium]
MSWLPKDANFLTVLGAILASATAGIAVITGIGQLAGPGRTRRAVEWLSAAVAEETDEARREALEFLKARRQGSLLAAQYIPWWRFTNTAFWVLLSPALIATATSANEGAGGYTLRIAAGTANLWMAFRRAIRLHSERVRIARHFALGGVRFVEPSIDILNQMEGGTKKEFYLAAATAVSVMSTATAAAFVLTNPESFRTIAWFGISAYATFSSIQTVHHYAVVEADRQVGINRAS